MVRDAYLLFLLSKIAEKPLLLFQIHAVNYYKLCALNDSSSVVITSPYFGGVHIFYFDCILCECGRFVMNLFRIYFTFWNKHITKLSGNSMAFIVYNRIPRSWKRYFQQAIKLKVKIWTPCHITPINVVIPNIRWFIFDIIPCTNEKWIVAKR